MHNTLGSILSTEKKNLKKEGRKEGRREGRREQGREGEKFIDKSK
jgi:hypothetical protein